MDWSYTIKWLGLIKQKKYDDKQKIRKMYQEATTSYKT